MRLASVGISNKEFSGLHELQDISKFASGGTPWLDELVVVVLPLVCLSFSRSKVKASFLPLDSTIEYDLPSLII